MRQSILRDLVILLGIFGLVWLVSSLFSFFPENPQLMSVEREQKLGEKYMQVVMLTPGFKEVENNKVDSAIQVVGSRLIEGLGRSDYEYRFVLFRNEMINAFTLPGGFILISTGLIGFCEAPEELAAVMAHEMGHVEKKHVIIRLAKELGTELLTSGDTYVLREVTGILTSTSFDRIQEEEADRFASALLEKSDMEPRILATIFRRLKDEAGNDLVQKFEIVSTHPNFNARIRDALSYKPAEDFEEKSIEVDWEMVQAEL